MARSALVLVVLVALARVNGGRVPESARTHFPLASGLRDRIACAGSGHPYTDRESNPLQLLSGAASRALTLIRGAHHDGERWSVRALATVHSSHSSFSRSRRGVRGNRSVDYVPIQFSEYEGGGMHSRKFEVIDKRCAFWRLSRSPMGARTGDDRERSRVAPGHTGETGLSLGSGNDIQYHP